MFIRALAVRTRVSRNVLSAHRAGTPDCCDSVSRSVRAIAFRWRAGGFNAGVRMLKCSAVESTDSTVNQRKVRVANHHDVDDFFPPTTTRLQVKRDGHSLIRRARIPKPVALIDTREQRPLPLLANHPNWIGGERRATLPTGDYTVEGMEQLLALERKSLPDLVSCTVSNRRNFLKQCDRLAKFRWKAILIEATFEDIKRGFRIPDVHPNSVAGTLDAIEVKHGIPVLYTSTVKNLATERAASWLSKHFTYYWLVGTRLWPALTG